MKVIEGGVTAAKGYKAAGLRAGIKAGKTNYIPLPGQALKWLPDTERKLYVPEHLQRML